MARNFGQGDPGAPGGGRGGGYTPGNNPFASSGSGTPPPAPGAPASNSNSLNANRQSGDGLTIKLFFAGKAYSYTLDSRLAQVMPGTGGATWEASAAFKIQQINAWSVNQLQQFAQQAYDAGLIGSIHASKTELLSAWVTVVQEAMLRNMGANKSVGGTRPEDLIHLAATNGRGWNGVSPTLGPTDAGAGGTGNPKNSPDNLGPGAPGPTQTQSVQNTQTTYVSYLDPATIQGALADAYFRLMGRNPTSAEYQAFLNSVYSYQDQANTGTYKNKLTDTSRNPVPKAGKKGQAAAPLPPAPGSMGGGAIGPGATDTNIQQNIVSQRGIGQRGLQFLAGQAAIANPEEAVYQAATTYFNAFMKALAGPAAGMQASGPTNTAP